jgi:4-hydroxy-2-oxoglutarate aldolase
MDLSGVYPPIVTPFRDDEVDVPAIRHNVARWMKTGLRGILALGSNGEAPFLDDDETERVLAAAREGVPRDRVFLVGTGRQSTRATIAATARAANAGADAVLVLTPSYFRAMMTHEALVAHYRAVADVSPVPILLYNFTAVTGVDITPDTVAVLAQHPNIIGIKDSNGSVEKVAAIVDRVPCGFTVFVGSATTLYPAMLVGAAGSIAGLVNVVPEVCVRLYDLIRAGQHEEARLLQRRITPLTRDATGRYGVAGVKAAMDMAGYIGGEVRKPLLPVTDEEREHIRRLLDELLA